jgi:regulation of enolase protein 1 (concanavalin A-like superfamily)
MACNKEVPMHRLAALLLCALVATGVVAAAGLLAAPAPFPRPPRAPRVWLDGWDKPVDPVGDCLFERKGDRLTIIVPGPGHGLDEHGDDRLNAPRLMRDVAGDFIVQVRVGGSFGPPGRDGNHERHQAGILVLFGANRVSHFRGVRPSKEGLYQYLGGGFWNGTRPQGHSYFDPVTPLGQTVVLRLERRGQRLILKVSPNRGVWKTSACSDRADFHLPQRLKVGVFAESTAGGTLMAVFDQFKLTPLGGKTR